MEENNSKKILLTVLGVAILVVAVVGISFALFTMNGETKANTITSGSITMSFSEVTNGISVTNALPMDETTALETYKDSKYFEFSVSTTANNLNVPYTVTVTKTNGDLTDEQIGINLQEKSGTDWVNKVTNTKVSGLTAYGSAGAKTLLNVDSNTGTTGGKTDTYRLRIWIDKGQDYSAVQGKSYSLRVDVLSDM